MIQLIKDKLEASPGSITHVLHVSVDGATSADGSNRALFARLANKEFSVKVRAGGGRWITLPVVWHAIERKFASAIYWGYFPLYSDRAVAQATKVIMQGWSPMCPEPDRLCSDITDALDRSLAFLVSKPLEYTDEDIIARNRTPVKV